MNVPAIFMKSAVNNHMNDEDKEKEKKLLINAPHIGMRTFKTAVVVFICLIIYYLADTISFLSHYDALMACIAGIISLQDSMEKTFQTGLNRIYGTAIGALMGMLFLYADRLTTSEILKIFIISFGIVTLILVCNGLKISDAIVISCVVFLVIVLEQTKELPYISSIRRLLDTIVGIIVAIIVNNFIRNPDKRKTDSDATDDFVP